MRSGSTWISRSTTSSARPDHKFAGAALALARKYEIIPTELTGDSAVVELAKKEDAYVLTNDKELRRRLRKERIPLIYLRSGTHLALETY